MPNTNEEIYSMKTDIELIKSRLSNIEKNIEKLGDTLNWLVKIIIGAFLLSLVGLVVNSALPMV